MTCFANIWFCFVWLPSQNVIVETISHPIPPTATIHIHFVPFKEFTTVMLSTLYVKLLLLMKPEDPPPPQIWKKNSFCIFSFLVMTSWLFLINIDTISIRIDFVPSIFDFAHMLPTPPPPAIASNFLFFLLLCNFKIMVLLLAFCLISNSFVCFIFFLSRAGQNK